MSFVKKMMKFKGKLMSIYDDRRPPIRISPTERRFDALMDKYMRKAALANSQDYSPYIGENPDILSILAYRDKLQRKGHI